MGAVGGNSVAQYVGHVLMVCELYRFFQGVWGPLMLPNGGRGPT